MGITPSRKLSYLLTTPSDFRPISVPASPKNIGVIHSTDTPLGTKLHSQIYSGFQ